MREEGRVYLQVCDFVWKRGGKREMEGENGGNEKEEEVEEEEDADDDERPQQAGGKKRFSMNIRSRGTLTPPPSESVDQTVDGRPPTETVRKTPVVCCRPRPA